MSNVVVNEYIKTVANDTEADNIGSLSVMV